MSDILKLSGNMREIPIERKYADTPGLSPDYINLLQMEGVHHSQVMDELQTAVAQGKLSPTLYRIIVVCIDVASGV